MTILKAIILGMVQGLTEFLPVSSSGHLALTQMILKIPENQVLFITTMLHFGTLISIIGVYYKDVTMLVVEFFRTIKDILTGKGLKLHNPYRRLGFFIILASIPTAIIGLSLKDFFESLFSMTKAIGISLVITGTLLWIAEKYNNGKKDIQKMNSKDALVVGFFQAFAITPGVSRSGSTIVGSLLMGLNKELTVKFSFLISLPAVIGATLLEVKDVLETGNMNVSGNVTLVGIVSAAIFGFIAIKSMIRFVKEKKLYYFSYYTWTVGIGVLLYSFWHS
ncbi:undecaprenyl-diphosphate phosphatase [Anaeromicrobium sediminis]|uniref:Undecaprenyl-diphosphatase n=1 Tax=Anaeromicrobium sediminis TaxID=1478221 RepID=A0A267MP72_9FIRM|nr:undecaprenyl-diphosphate phosphatase [Anaeromicrobium sediminis]PAB61212.1 undecaprenyl-diphosphatase [Anaeromicrobium sediminis]